MRPVLKRLTDAELRKFGVSRTSFTSPKSIAKNLQHVCHYCEKKFPYYLDRHVRGCHLKEKKYSCNQFSYGTSQEYTIKRHIIN